MTIWILKGCPRCGGDLFVGEQDGAWFESCLQCGFLREQIADPVPDEAFLSIKARQEVA